MISYPLVEVVSWSMHGCIGTFVDYQKSHMCRSNKYTIAMLGKKCKKRDHEEIGGKQEAIE